MASPISAAVSGRLSSPGPSSPSSASQRFYRPELDTLRFAAFVLVFLHHALPHSSAELPALARPVAALLAAAARAGAWGVDLFFALSSYLITSLLLRELAERGAVDVRAFYVRRMLRIWPLYFAALLIFAPALAAASSAESLPLRYVGAYSLLAGNWACAWWGFPASSFASLWSVSIEEQFYLTFPLFVRKSARYLPHLAIGALIAANATRVFVVVNGTAHPGIWCNTLTRLDPIALGVLLACGPPLRFSRAGRMAMVAAAGAAFFALGLFGAHSGARALFTYPLAALASAATVAAMLGSTASAATGCTVGGTSPIRQLGASPATRDSPKLTSGAGFAHWRGAEANDSHGRGTSRQGMGRHPHGQKITVRRTPFFRVLLSSETGAVPGLRYLGKISYGLYVFHAAAIRLVDATGIHLALSLPLSLATSIAIAALSYRFLESPFLQWKERFARVPSRPV